jgi:dTMP kinase
MREVGKIQEKMREQGMLLTLEGIEGVGKSTQIALLQEVLAQKREVICVREPGGTEIGSHIRKLLLDPTIEETFAPFTELFLYAASRAQLMTQIIQPALDAGKIVLCDRFIDSTVAYQAYGGGVALADVEKINFQATNGVMPTRTYLLDLPLTVSEQRMATRGMKKDRMEQKEIAFHKRVRAGFLEIAKRDPQRVKVIDATQSPAKICMEITADLQKYL